MRVLMTADAVGGVWAYSLELADALGADGIEVTLAVMGPPPTDAQRRQAADSAVVDVRHGPFDLEWMDDPWPGVDRAAEWLLALADDIGADVVHLNGYVHAALPWQQPCLVVAHSDVFSWWWAVHGEAPPPAWQEYQRRVAAGLAAATAVVAPTAAVLRDLERWYGFGGGTVIPNCRTTGWVVETDKARMVVGAGRVWDDAKNLTLLDRAARHLEWPVVIAGDQGDVSIEAAQPVGRLAFYELAALLGRAAVFSLPAHYEPFGLGPLEAALSGCALVLGDIPSLREVWGGAALYVNPAEEGELVAVLGHLLADPEVAASWGARARRRATAYAPEATAAAYAHTYRGLRTAVRGNR